MSLEPSIHAPIPGDGGGPRRPGFRRRLSGRPSLTGLLVLVALAGAAEAQTFDVVVADGGPADVGAYAALGLPPGNLPASIVYYDATTGDLKHAYQNSTRHWLEEVVDTAGDVGRHASMVVGDTGWVHVAYRDETNRALKYAVHRFGSWGVETVDAVGDVGVHTSIALDPIGGPVISYYDEGNQDLKIAFRAPGATTWTIRTCCESVPVGRAPVVADLTGIHLAYFIGSPRQVRTRRYDRTLDDWDPHVVAAAVTLPLDINYVRRGWEYISYTDVTASALDNVFFASRSPGQISWPQPELVQEGAGSSSLALDSAHVPAIAYHYTGSTGPAPGLYYARRDGASWNVVAVDVPSGAYVGDHASLAFDYCDNPHIAYRDATAGDLKHAFAETPYGCHEDLVDNGDGTVSDRSRGLMWLRDANAFDAVDPGDGRTTWEDAVTFADEATYAGYTDWRLPATAEPDPTCSSQAPFDPVNPVIEVVRGCRNSEMGGLRWRQGVHSLSPGPFINVQGRGRYYWSGTEWMGSPGLRAWIHSFYYGDQGPANKAAAAPYVWLVRDIRSATVASATGGGDVTFETDQGRIGRLTAHPESEAPTAGRPTGVSFPYGFFSWEVTGIVPGSTVQITITYPADVATGAQYWKIYGGVWTDVTGQLSDDDGDNVLVLSVTDGGPGDADGAANGAIVDPGSLAQRRPWWRKAVVIGTIAVAGILALLLLR